MKKVSFILFLAIAVMGLGFTGLLAQEKAQGTVDAQMKTFMEKAAGDGIFEVEAGKMAMQKSNNPTVKQFAQRMIQDHSQANQQLMQIASMKGVTIPPQMDQKHQKLFDELQKAQNFDKKYADEMVKDHKEGVSDFENEKSKATDPDLKKFVDNTLPILREHLKLAEEMQKKVG